MHFERTPIRILMSCTHEGSWNCLLLSEYNFIGTKVFTCPPRTVPLQRNLEKSCGISCEAMLLTWSCFSSSCSASLPCAGLSSLSSLTGLSPMMTGSFIALYKWGAQRWVFFLQAQWATVSRLLYFVSCLPSTFSRFLYLVSCLPSPVSRFTSPVSLLTSPVSRLFSHVSCLPSPVFLLRIKKFNPFLIKNKVWVMSHESSNLGHG